MEWTADAEIQAGWSWRGRQVSERIDGSRSHVDATEIISIQVCIHFSVKLFRDCKTITRIGELEGFLLAFLGILLGLLSGTFRSNSRGFWGTLKVMTEETYRTKLVWSLVTQITASG